MTLNLAAFLGPLARAPGAHGVLCLYAPSAERLRGIEEADPDARGRARLRRLVSLTDRKKLDQKVEPLPEHIAAALSDDEIVAIADAYRERLPRRRVYAPGEPPRAPAPPRESSETPAAYLDRVLSDELAYDAAETRRVMDKAIAGIGGTAGDALKQLRGSGDHLEQVILRSREQARRSFVESPMNDIILRQAQERREEREWVRGTLQMTTQSAEALRSLVDASATMMVRWDERDAQAKGDTKRQLRWAIFSLFLSMALAGATLLYTIRHDQAKDALDAQAGKDAAARDERLTRAMEQNTKAMQDAAAALQNLRPAPARRRPASAPRTN